MAVLEVLLVCVGLGCLAVLLVIGAVALVRDWLSERANRRRLVEIVRLVRQEIAERGEAPGVDHDGPATGRHAA